MAEQQLFCSPATCFQKRWSNTVANTTKIQKKCCGLSPAFFQSILPSFSHFYMQNLNPNGFHRRTRKRARFLKLMPLRYYRPQGSSRYKKDTKLRESFPMFERNPKNKRGYDGQNSGGFYTMQPNLNIPLYLVAPEERREKVMTEVNRPTFCRLSPPLSEICRFISFSGFKEHISQAAAYIRYLKPEFLDELSESYELEEA